MELRHLRYFIAVAEELSFTKAAQRLFTAQPSLSMQIKQLEEEVGVSLLDRSSKSIRLTPEGVAFLAEAEKVLNQVKIAINTARQVANSREERLNIGFLPVAEMKIFPQIIPELKQKFPNLNIQFMSLTCREQLDRLRSGELDIAFTRHCINEENFESHFLFSEQLYLAMHTDSPLAKYDIVPIKQLNDCDFVISDSNFSFELNRIIREFLFKQKIEIKNFYYSKNILFNINSIAMGLGYSFVPAYVKSIIPKQVVLKQTDKPLPKIGLYMTFSKTNTSRLQDELIRLVNKYVSN
ncbi:LysR substrate-binding domain-containing protein [Acinetobacter sp. MB5]|uniref:LysR substrate-binding domain-containing protein n=1 Tax=Acinetobacter sp. MB5 TaxID=2069438 RepID=UPI000DCF914C|nr:LysR substrate-binding domain-containing protein [Acinetobacter sp. MB5]